MRRTPSFAIERLSCNVIARNVERRFCIRVPFNCLIHRGVQNAGLSRIESFDCLQKMILDDVFDRLRRFAVVGRKGTAPGDTRRGFPPTANALICIDPNDGVMADTRSHLASPGVVAAIRQRHQEHFTINDLHTRISQITYKRNRQLPAAVCR